METWGNPGNTRHRLTHIKGPYHRFSGVGNSFTSLLTSAIPPHYFFTSMVDSSNSMGDTANMSRSIQAGHRLGINAVRSLEHTPRNTVFYEPLQPVK